MKAFVKHAAIVSDYIVAALNPEEPNLLDLLWKFMIVFIIPLKSAKVSKSWDRTCSLLERTLKSICGQTCDDFRIIVVCHEKPFLDFITPFVEFIETDQQILSGGCFIGHRDMSEKLRIGLERSKQYHPSHVMVVDADDLVSNKIAGFVKKNSEQIGWILNSGYIHEFKNKYLYYLRKDFGQYCGSSVIIKPDLFECLFTEEDYYVHKCSTLPAHGISLNNLPFCGAIYSRVNGENIFAVDPFYKNLLPKGDYIAYLKHLTRFRFITPQVKNGFGFYEV